MRKRKGANPDLESCPFFWKRGENEKRGKRRRAPVERNI